MSKCNTLPPNVIGKTRGIIEIEVFDIIWTANKKPINYKGVISNQQCKTDNYISNLNILKFIWWGENQQIGLQCEYSQNKKKLKKIIIQYNICTSVKLFYEYIKNCEPIEVKITSKTSNLHIGNVFVKIPENFLQILSNPIISCQTKNQIYNPRNKILGDLILNMKFEYYEPYSPNIGGISSSLSSNTLLTKTDPETGNIRSTNFNKGYETYTIEKNSSRQSGRSTNCSSRVMDYLTGRTMSYDDEQEALKEIHRTSPIKDLILNDLPSFRARNNKSTVNLCKIPHPLKEKIDSLRVKLKNIRLLPPGIREVYVDSLKNTAFTVECKITPNILDNCQGAIRFYSDSYDDIEQRIDFNKEAIRCIKIIFNEFDPLIVEHSEILFTIWWRQFGEKQPRCLGTTKFRFTNLINLPDYEQYIKLHINSCAGGVHVADLICKFSLGSNAVQFGHNEIITIENIYNHTERSNESTFSTKSNYNNKFARNKILCERNYIDKIRTIPNSSNTSNTTTASDSKSSSPQENCNVTTSTNTQTTQSQQSTQSTSTQFSSNHREEKDLNKLKLQEDKNDGNFRLLQGLLYVGSIKNLPPIVNGGYFLVCRAFWKEDATSTEFVECNNFNFLEMFPVINDEKFLERTRNNHLKLEVWQKSLETAEQLIGVVRLPLHQFFIAFRDTELTNHLCKSKNPVISIDGWVSIVSPLSGTNCGQLQTLLAVGTEEQLEELKLKRGIVSDSVYVNASSSPRIPVPELSSRNIQNQFKRTESVQTSINGINKSTNTSTTAVGQREKFTDLLGSFIENLQQTMPSKESSSKLESKLSNQKPITVNHQNQQEKVCLTSDLLDVLQKALINRPSTSDCIIPGLVPSNNTTESSVNVKNCKILLEIEGALHLPKNPVKLISKKSGTQKRNKEKQSLRFPPNEEPSTYVTFQAIEGYGTMIKSHEGMVYATNIIEKCSNPSWGKVFEIAVPIDMLVNEEKHFILKVWKKAVTNVSQNRLVPTPMEDSIIGFAAIDLTVLMARMPCISGWFNIVDFNGRINGQLKVNVKPLEDVMKFKVNKNWSKIPSKNCVDNYCTDSKELQTNLSSLTSALNLDLNSETNSSASNDDIGDLKNVTLSRAIKRKFTELEEITQRLRARLLDVTGAVDAGTNDGNFLNEFEDDAQLDEFERDLNTICNDEDDGNFQDCQYFNRKSSSDYNKTNTNKNDENKNDNLSSRTYVTEDEIESTSTSNERIHMISNYLQRTEINLNANNDLKSSDDGINNEQYGNNL